MNETYETAELIASACAAAVALAPAEFPPDLPPDPAINNAPAWYGFENPAWSIGEKIRQSLSASPKLRKNPQVLRAILDVAHHANLRRGRQSFVMALGFTSAAAHASDLAPLVADPDVDGHVMDTLLKMRAPGFGAEATFLLSHKQAWVRRLAKRYIDRYGVPPNNSFKPMPLRGTA